MDSAYQRQPRHVCRGCLSWAGDVLWRCLLVHALHCSVTQRSRLMPPSVSPNSDISGKQSPYPDGDPDRHQNLTVCSSAHYQRSLQVSCQSVGKFLRKVANRQTDRQTDKEVRQQACKTQIPPYGLTRRAPLIPTAYRPRALNSDSPNAILYSSYRK